MSGEASSTQNTPGAADPVPAASAGGSGGDAAWDGMFRQLTQYKAAHGHCFVPLRCRENPKLGAWLAEQAGHFQKLRLPPERQQALEELGFQWDFDEPRGKTRTDEQRWEQRFAELVAFSQQVGAEDNDLVRNVQAGLDSGLVPQGRLLLTSERLIAHFQRLVHTALSAP